MKTKGRGGNALMVDWLCFWDTFSILFCNDYNYGQLSLFLFFYYKLRQQYFKMTSQWFLIKNDVGLIALNNYLLQNREYRLSKLATFNCCTNLLATSNLIKNLVTSTLNNFTTNSSKSQKPHNQLAKWI